jgi:SAM-dependent methyltransferase
MKSYVKTRLGALGRLNETWSLHLGHTKHAKENVSALLHQASDANTKISQLLGTPVVGCDMLEIGPGQQLVQLAYFARNNEVVGIDLDLIVQSLTFKSCMKMAATNGWLRTCKTVGRKLARIDARMRAELLSQLDLSEIPELRVQQMDAARMEFPKNRFDVVFSRAVFEHLPDPRAVLSEVKRVLKPGGVMFIVLHLYTSDSGCHDARIFAGDRRSVPFWSHLRAEHQHTVRPNSYLNKLRLAEWRQVFESTLPGSQVVALCDAQDVERQELRKLRSLGELPTYSDEELLTVTVEATWEKPKEG